MSTAAGERQDLGHLIERSDFWRRSPASAGGRAGHKEWNYFCVLAEDLDLIVNLSIMDSGPQASGTPNRLEEARVLVLARTSDGRWYGDVETCDRAIVGLHAGRVEAQLGRSTLAFTDGAYRLDVRMGEDSIAARLTLRPTTRPALARSVPLGPTEPMHWLVVPRLEATGGVRIGNMCCQVDRARAYHDHNWGRFSWGGDFAWEWAVALAGRPVPWSLVYYRITDRGRHRAISQGVLLWRRDQHCRTFRDIDVRVRSTGLLRVGRALRVPRIMSLAIPGTASDIPSRLEIQARCGIDTLDVTLDLTDCAQVGIPNDGDAEMTCISECHGMIRASGRVRGEPVCFEAPSVVEFNRAV
jgi:hypothetical protein